MKPSPANPLFSLIAWAVTLFVSLLPDIAFRELTGHSPAWLYWVQLGVLGAGLLACLAWSRLRPLRLFFTVVLLVCGLTRGVDWALQAIHYTAWLAAGSPFVQTVGQTQIPRFAAAVLLALLLRVGLGRFERFFFIPGRLEAAAAPIPLIMTRPTPWRILGPFIAGAMSLGLVVFALVFGKPPTWQALAQVLPALPFVLLFAATNAFGEEMLYRAPWLAALEAPLGPAQALLLTAVFFGVGHYYGVPYGLVGIGMAFIPGWLMGKAMLETRGFFWAWFIHIWMDIVVLATVALGSIRPGG